jgi:hypothetical protein
MATSSSTSSTSPMATTMPPGTSPSSTFYGNATTTFPTTGQIVSTVITCKFPIFIYHLRRESNHLTNNPRCLHRYLYLQRRNQEIHNYHNHRIPALRLYRHETTHSPRHYHDCGLRA